MNSTLRYFRGSFAFAAVAFAAGAAVGWYYHRAASGVGSALFTIAMLGVLETSLSFDNAVVNASVLRDMSPVWRRRFITWGIAIAVFGMRLVFPLGVVSAVASVGPGEALRLAAFEPEEYARILTEAHAALGAFGGAFLGMVFLSYFIDSEKETHWIGVVEPWMARAGKIEAAALGVILAALCGVSRLLPSAERGTFLVAGILGLVAFIAVDGLGSLLGASQAQVKDVRRSGAASFLYLEVLDASFSFDGVIGAFALTNNLFIIALGLGIGAMFVRSLTVMLVDRGTLEAFCYLEHGAFWAIGSLAALMLAGTAVAIPEAVTGLMGAALIGLSIRSSIPHRKRTSARVDATPGPWPE